MIKTDKHYRFSFFDALIVILVMIFISFPVFEDKNSVTPTNGEVYYTLTVSGIDAQLEDDIKTSDVVRDENGCILGTVQQVISKETIVREFDPESGEYAIIYDYSKRDIDIKIFSKANLSGSSYTVDGRDVCVGQIYKIHTSDFYAEGMCTSLQARSEENG